MSLKKMIAILGAGIAGISCSYHLSLKNIASSIYEMNDDWGGTCNHFLVKGFRFENGPHFSFTKNDYVKQLFHASSVPSGYSPDIWCNKDGLWVRHPVQSHLYALPIIERLLILKDYIRRDKNKKVENYEDWLLSRYGVEFSRRYPMPYTHKYWTVSAKEMSASWIGEKIRTPSRIELIKNAVIRSDQNYYYADKMYYPQKGGFRSFFSEMTSSCNIQFKKKAVRINPKTKKIFFLDGTSANYESLISSMPLPELISIVEDVPKYIVKAADDLHCTSAILVSVGLKKQIKSKMLWMYLYDSNKLPCRINIASNKSKENAPENCSSIQFEIYFSHDKPIKYSKRKIAEHALNVGRVLGFYSYGDIEVVNIKTLKYANIIVDHKWEQATSTINNYMKKIGIRLIGRYGMWDYLWSDQSLLSGKITAERYQV